MFRSSVVVSFLACVAVSGSLAQRTIPPAAPADTAAPAASASPATNSKPAEDWSKLEVDRSALKPLLNGAVLGKEEKATYTRELIRFEWRHGDPIDVYLVTPRGVVKPKVVLYLYNFGDDVDRFMNELWCEHATHNGLAAVGFVSALSGVRFRNRPMKEWFISELQESMGSTVHDVQLILDYLGTRPDLAASQVGMIGQGSGGSIAILAAAADPRIRVLDLLNPWGDWPDWLKSSPVVPDAERVRYLTPEFLQKASAVDPVRFLPRLRDRTLRVGQIMEDPDTPTAAKEKIAAAVPAASLIQYETVAAHREAWKVTGLTGWMAAQPEMKRFSDTAGVANKLP